MTWLFENTAVETPPEDAIGFVYLIENLTNGRKYIGKKLLAFSRVSVKTVTLKNGTKKKKKVRSKIESDWRDYWSSSDELKKDVETLGIVSFKRTILQYCYSKAECTYVEAREQFARRVLETDEYYNGQISCRIHKAHIKNKIKK